MKNIALILASGKGTRLKSDCPKQFLKIGNKCILQYTIEKFENNPDIDAIYIVTNPEYMEKVKELSDSYSKVCKVVAGGKTRKDSSYNGITAINEDECNVLIHDGVRPLVPDDIIKRCIKELENSQAVCTAIDSTDTVYITDNDDYIKTIPQRVYVKCAQTPQCFKLSLIKKAHELALNDKNCIVTDDCGLIDYYKLAKIKIVNGSQANIKITFADDIELAKKYL